VEQGTHAELLAADGIYARLVRIQTQVSKHPTVDTILAQDEDGKPPVPAEGEEDGPATARQPEGIEWLDPSDHRFVSGAHDRIELWSRDRRLAAGIFVVRTFPATHPEAYLSVRGWNESGDEIELGMIRSLDDWGDDSRKVVLAALARRSLVRSINRVHQVTLAQGYLDFDVDTDVGRRQFTTRWTQGQVLDFGVDGKMLIDTEENRYIIPRVAALPKPDRERFLQYVYW
jgi:hypothetical protein